MGQNLHTTVDQPNDDAVEQRYRWIFFGLNVIFHERPWNGGRKTIIGKLRNFGVVLVKSQNNNNNNLEMPCLSG